MIIPGIPFPVSVRTAAISGALVLAFAGGSGLAWTWQATRMTTAAAEHQAAMESLRATYAQTQAQGEADARKAMEAVNNEAREADKRYQAEITRLRAAAAHRPARIIRVCGPALPAATSPGGRAADGAGGFADSAANTGGVGPADGEGTRTVDLSGLDTLILDEAKVVSSRLWALQGLCGG